MDKDSESPNQKPVQAAGLSGVSPSSITSNFSSDRPSTPIFSKNTPVPPTPEKSPRPFKAHPFVANHPTQTFASEAGDIVLSSDTQPLKTRRKKKPLLWIAAALLTATVIIGIIVAAISGSFSNTSTTRLHEDFNKYANYFLYSTDSAADIEGAYQYGDRYALSGIAGEETATHIDNAKKKYQKFLESYHSYTANHADAVDEETAALVNSYYNKLELFGYLLEHPNLTAQDILDVFIEQPETVAQLAVEYYGYSGDVQEIHDFAADYLASVYSLLEAYEAYSTNGCIDEGAVMRMCQRDANNPELTEANEKYASFNSFYREMAEKYKIVTTDVYQDIWYINRGLGE